MELVTRAASQFFLQLVLSNPQYAESVVEPTKYLTALFLRIKKRFLKERRRCRKQ
jgi:hypothetical protein